MKFTIKELDQIVERKIDKIVLFSKNQPVLSIDIDEQIAKRIESDPNLKRQLVAQVLDSED